MGSKQRTLYPLLKDLEEEHLIRIVETGKRSKNIYRLTSFGEKTLQQIRGHRKESREKMLVLRNLFIEIFRQDKSTLYRLFFEIRIVIDDLSPDNNGRAARILEKCIDDLRRIKSDVCDTR
ncbi:helix-turn-helix transcriptional regulator [Methanohalophilus euhalobius]|uniref:PadR family transcriptional regulator n=1 Tax=Methanohalophilus euhalobius TaxID=51203 RepID=A0A314ZZQ5_9EURY|nr:helix-turn-helix transcriptional regulator [Methanohalophilus euhalobius]PQV43703.1 PadR family transcriptional regulator [Methanohalophilus euhalobius]RNI12696.1 hypothetical protein EDD83_00775 [Methanohalophilus euhalobius]